ncbi:MAG: type II toxin-antitoxin system HipA family toxin [Pyrinomonadaceae bacterium]
MTIARVNLWGRMIGAVSWNAEENKANFEYEAEFTKSGIEVSPLEMPLSSKIYSFPSLAFETFHGLPGMLADSLPDGFGNALINAWLAKEGRNPAGFNPVERLCYTGARGMGALEYVPSTGPNPAKANEIDIDSLVKLAREILTSRENFHGSFNLSERENSLQEILRVGTSAGGARAKAIIAWNPDTEEVRSGQIDAGSGFSYWLLKFDGVSGNKDKELEDPAGSGLIEYAYYKMATAAGIKMSECRLLSENSRNHFMTKRFDRTDNGEKIHMQTFSGLAHLDFNQAGAHSYEQALRTIRMLGMPMQSIEEQFRRMTFNIVARNQDDHVKNIAFLMDKAGNWSLSPAFDMTYSHNPNGIWTSRHQMKLNGKRDDFELEDFKTCAKTVSMKRGRAEEILKEVQSAVSKWPDFAEDSGVDYETAVKIGRSHRLDLM